MFPEEVFGFVSNPINAPAWETALLLGQTLGSPKGIGSKTARMCKLLSSQFESTARTPDFEPTSK